MRQGRAVPHEIAGDVGAGAGVGQPVLSICEQREVQPVGVAVPAAVAAAFQARVAFGRAQDGQTLPLEQHGAGLPRFPLGQGGRHLEQRPP